MECPERHKSTITFKIIQNENNNTLNQLMSGWLKYLTHLVIERQGKLDIVV